LAVCSRDVWKSAQLGSIRSSLVDYVSTLTLITFILTAIVILSCTSSINYRFSLIPTNFKDNISIRLTLVISIITNNLKPYSFIVTIAYCLLVILKARLIIR